MSTPRSPAAPTNFVSKDATHVVALSGGVGGAKLARGLARVLDASELTVVCNTGDDFEHLGLHISPDLDSVLYAMAGVSDIVRGWGRTDETWSFMAAIRGLGLPDWFNLGDRDLATHVWRQAELANGATLSEITSGLAMRFGLAHRLLPMSDSAVRTRLDTDAGLLDFQDYFVRRRAGPRVLRVQFDGASQARAPLALAELAPSLIVICPSNPYLSIDPILAIPDWQQWLRQRRCPVVAVSPIVAGDAIKGCAAKMMREFGQPVAPITVAKHYRDHLDGLMIDALDAAQRGDIEALGVRCAVAQTVMRDDADRETLAAAVIAFGHSLARAAATGQPAATPRVQLR